MIPPNPLTNNAQAQSGYGQFIKDTLMGGAMKYGLPSIGTFGLGAVQTIASYLALKKLQRQERPNYAISPEMQQAYNLSEQRSKFGFTPTQIANYEQNLARAQSADFYNARNMGGGGLAQALSGRGAGQRLSSLNQFAGQDAAQQAANIGQYYGMAGQMQGQRNRIASQDIAYRMAQEQALGQSLKAGTTNLANVFNRAGIGMSEGFGKIQELKAQYREATKGMENPPSIEDWYNQSYKPSSSSSSGGFGGSGGMGGFGGYGGMGGFGGYGGMGGFGGYGGYGGYGGPYNDGYYQPYQKQFNPFEPVNPK